MVIYSCMLIHQKYQDRGIWIGDTGVGIYKFNIDLSMIKWADEQPWKNI